MSDVTWQFKDGEPALVAHLPGNTAWRLDHFSELDDLTPREREFARALIRLATMRLDETEPARAYGSAANS